MTWTRAASLALLAHLAVLALFTFTFQGTPSMYRLDLVFWGPILRPREVASPQAIFSPGPRDIKDARFVEDSGAGRLVWAREISVDKPDLFRNTVLALNDDAFRFVGERVDLDEQDAGALPVENDIPPPAPVTMRWEQP